LPERQRRNCRRHGSKVSSTTWNAVPADQEISCLFRLDRWDHFCDLLVHTPLTAFLAFLLLGEPVNAAQMAGGALVVLLGVWIVNPYSRGETVLADA
jgi:hypothetical protein